MKFSEVLAQAIAWLEREGRVSYRALKREFELDDSYLEDLKEELIETKEVAVDKDGKMLVWVGAVLAPPSITVQAPQPSHEPGAQPSPPSPQQSPPPTQQSSLDGSAEPESSSQAERRQVTVQFIDLVGSTALSERLDPEELREIIRAYQKACAGAIRDYEGHIAKYLGDGLLIYFGYPTAHEDDAARAIRAGLGVVEAVRELSRRLAHPIQVRVGIHTGVVIVGEMGSGQFREAGAVVGVTPNIAARLQEKAQPDTVVISAATARLLHDTFVLEDLGPQMLKGIAEPMAVLRVVSLVAENSDEEDDELANLPFLVGRDEEIGLLRRRWEQSKEGLGQTVLINGEAGIGKTALSETLRALVLQEGHTCITFRCSPYHQNSSLYPILNFLQALFRFEPDDSSAVKLEKLERVMGRYPFQLEEMVPLLAALLTIAVPEKRYPPLTLSSQQQRQRTHDALAAWMAEEARRKPVLVIWEDVHQADPSTLELLGLAMDQAPTVPVLNVLTFRPDFMPPWTTRSHMTPITLNRLERPQVEAMVLYLTGGKPLPREVVQQIVSKTDGVPLFVEELTKMVLESDFLRIVDDRYELTRALPALAIPSTLQDLLMARLDRWPEVREVAQLGAVFGREFAYEMLQNLTTVEEPTLQERLAQLVEAELLYQRGRPPRAKYFFRHALIQDAAYASLLRSVRQHYHQQIAHLFEKQFPDIVELQPEGIAYHYTEAGLAEQAVPYWQQAGQRAMQRSANVEAVRHLTKGLDVLATLPETPERVQQELMLHVTRGAPLVATKGFADPEVENAFTRLREICRQLGDPPQLFPVLFRLRSFYMVRGDLHTSQELGEQLLRLAESVQDPGLLLEAHYALGATLFYQGKLVLAQKHLGQVSTLYDPQQHSAHAFFYGQDPGVACLSNEAFALWIMGYPDRAQSKSQEALALAQKIAHPFSLGFAWAFGSQVHQFRREERASQEQAEAAITLSTEQGFPFWLAFGTVLRGWALAEQGRREEGIALMRQGLAAYRATGSELARSQFLSLLVEECVKAGQIEEGLAALTEAFDMVESNDEHIIEARLCQLKGELVLQARDRSPETNMKEAERCFQQAIQMARRQEAKSLELSAATSLARLWQKQGKTKEAHQLLSEIYEWFTEGFATKDLQEAKALLEALA